MARPPVACSGDSSGRTTSCPGASTARDASSPMVRPVTVMAACVQAARFDQPLRDDRRAASRVEVGRDEPAAGLEIGQERHRRADPIEVVEARAGRRLLSRSPCRCRTALVDPPVAATDGDGVLERGRRQNLPRPEVPPHEIDDELARLSRDVVLAGVHRRHRGAAERREAEELARRGHRVRRELAAAGARARTRRVLERGELRRRRACPQSNAPTASKTSWIVTSLPCQRPGAIDPP